MALALLAAGIARAAAPDGIDDLGAARAARLMAREKRALTAAARKLDTRLRPLAWPVRKTSPRSPLVAAAPMQHVADGRVRVYVRLAALDEDALARLGAAGVEVEMVDRAGGRAQAVVDARQLRDLAALPSVLAIRPAERGRLRTGSVTSAGDAAARADLVRGLGYDGSGTVVGVISDGIDHAAVAQATGDLPAVMVPADARCRPGSGDEGTALLEIVHDLAPGAQLVFSEGLTSGLVFIDSVNCLVAAGAGVIADDLVFFDEPFFADGPLALAVRAAVQTGVSYHSAAGNEAEEHVEQPFRASPDSSFHDFLGGPVDNADDMLVLPGVTLVCFLQWNDPFGGSANDYDLGIFDGALNLIASSTGMQDGTQDPFEVAGVTNTSGSAQVAKVAIAKFSGADRVLEMFCLDGVQQQYVTDGSVIAQAALPEVVAVGAIDVNDPGRVDVEPYSSRGPAQVFFPAPATRPKPDLAGFDGVSISNAGGFPACPPSCAFFGTSAATPHSAAVAALLLSKNPSLTPAHIQDALRRGAVDIGPAGFDEAAGAGRLDALAAAALVCTTDAQCDDGDACTEDACDRGACTHSPVVCDDGDACTEDACDRGVCTHSPVVCDNDNVCEGAESCDPSAGCRAGTPLVCDDSDPCTVDTCDPASGCRSTELPGLDFVSCALDQHLAPLLPPAAGAPGRAAKTAHKLAAQLGSAERLVADARGTRSARARTLLKRARKVVTAMGRLAGRRTSGLGQTIVEPIVLETATIASRMRSLQRTL